MNIRKMTVKKIISGGQTDADHTVMDAAIKLGVLYGGWMPKGRMTEAGPLPAKYQLQEMPTDNYYDCIKQNVLDAKGTLILSSGRLADDLNYARKATLKHRRQLLGVDTKQTVFFKASSLVNDWVQLQHVDVLYVITPSIKTDTNVVKHTQQIVKGALLLDIMEGSAGSRINHNTKEKYLATIFAPPKTVAEVVSQIVSNLPLKDRVRIAKMKITDLEPVYMTLGIFVRNQVLQNNMNKELFESCRRISGNDNLNEVTASFVIIEKLWEKLQKSHRLRVVK